MMALRNRPYLISTAFDRLDGEGREIHAGGHVADNGHDDVGDQGRDDGREGGADDDADSQVDDVALHSEILEFFPSLLHWQLPRLMARLGPVPGARRQDYAEKSQHKSSLKG